MLKANAFTNFRRGKMFYKHWKKIALAFTALFWGGCGDDSSSDSKELVACDLQQMCPEYGVAGYSCDDGFYGDDNGQNCTFIPAPTCSRYYQCEDNVTCWSNEGDTVLNCSDKQGKDFSITEDEFKSKYYVEGERIH